MLPYDENRVRLPVPAGESPESDYINASYLFGADPTKCYIATQGPKDNTVDDFWTMVWEDDVNGAYSHERCDPLFARFVLIAVG